MTVNISKRTSVSTHKRVSWVTSFLMSLRNLLDSMLAELIHMSMVTTWSVGRSQANSTTTWTCGFCTASMRRLPSSFEISTLAVRNAAHKFMCFISSFKNVQQKSEVEHKPLYKVSPHESISHIMQNLSNNDFPFRKDWLDSWLLTDGMWIPSP